ncbi:MAG: hypothetical protein ACE5Q6_07915 [Dehalococcoidia bacterium]
MIKFIIAQGIGFNPGSVKYLPTLGFVSLLVGWVRLREIDSLGDGRSLKDLEDDRSIALVGDDRNVSVITDRRGIESVADRRSIK